MQQQDRRQMRELRRQAARRRRIVRTWIALGVCALLLAGGVGVFAWSRARAGVGTAAVPVTPSVTSTPVATTPTVTPEPAQTATLPPEPQPEPAASVPDGPSEAVKDAAVDFPDAPSVKPTSISQLKPKHKYIAITIDDGGGYQPEMLELLLKYDARCTTFVLGNWASQNESTLKKLHESGFEIANHTWDHKTLTKLSDSQVESELLRTQKVISKVTGNQAPYMRPPGGATNTRVKGLVADLGYKQIMWSRSFGDSGRGATTKKLYENVVTSNGGIEPGDIILCHWGSEATYKAMKKILPDLKAQGYEFVTVSELIADSK